MSDRLEIKSPEEYIDRDDCFWHIMYIGLRKSTNNLKNKKRKENGRHS